MFGIPWFGRKNAVIDQIVVRDAPTSFLPLEHSFELVAYTSYRGFDTRFALRYKNPDASKGGLDSFVQVTPQETPTHDFGAYFNFLISAWKSIRLPERAEVGGIIVYYSPEISIYALEKMWKVQGKDKSKIKLVGLESKIEVFEKSLQKP